MPARAGVVSNMPLDDPREKYLEEFRKQYPLRDAESEMIDDEIRKKHNLPPLARTAKQGVKDMQARIEMVKGDKAKLLDAMDGATGHRLADLTKVLNEYNQEIAEAEARLTEYKAQQGLN
jgi:hypothetical protein